MFRRMACVTAVLLASAGQARAAEPKVYAEGLDNPSGVAVHAGGDVFVAARDGIVRFHGGKKSMEVNGYPTDIYGKGPKYNIGPLGVAFMDGEHLIVGDGSRPDAEELLRVYKVSTTPGANPQKENTAAFTLGPIGPSAESAKGEGNFYAIAVTSGAMFITSNGDDTKGWILRAPIEGGKPGTLKPFIATKVATEVDAPVGITVNKEGDLVVGQMGEVNMAGDSLLTTYDAKTGKLKSKHATGLHDIAGLAYSPRTGKLYGVDFAWVDTKQGGLFELTVAGDKCTAKKVAALDKPTALAFDKDGKLYVTVYGTAKEGSSTPGGQVLVFDAGL